MHPARSTFDPRRGSRRNLFAPFDSDDAYLTPEPPDPWPGNDDPRIAWGYEIARSEDVLDAVWQRNARAAPQDDAWLDMPGIFSTGVRTSSRAPAYAFAALLALLGMAKAYDILRPPPAPAPRA